MKNDKFFKHDVSAANDEKILMLIEEEGMKGYGAYWVLLEALRRQEDLRSSLKILIPLAVRSKVSKKYLLHIVTDFDLFVVEGDCFYSLGLMRRTSWHQIATDFKGNKQSVKNGANSLENRGEFPAHTRIDGDKTIQDKKLSVVDVDRIEGQNPIQAYPGWEALVDEMAASEDYMNQAGTHSGLGMLFIRNRKFIVQFFKNHVCLQGKQGRMINLGEVKSYFTNFVANGTITNKKIRIALRQVIARQNGQYAYRFEDVVNGKRMYLGHAIPNDAPPRPDASAVWDDVKKKWGN